MIDPHSPIVSQDSQAGQEPGMEEQKMATPKSKLLTPLSPRPARLSCYKAQSKLYTFQITSG